MTQRLQRILARFLAQGFAAQDLARVTVVRSRKDGVPRVIAFARVTLFGPGATRLHDDLVAVAASWPEWEAPLDVFGDKEDRRAVERLEQLLVDSPTLEGVGARAREQIRKAAPAHFDTLWPHLEAEAGSIVRDVTEDLHRRGEHEARGLERILDQQVALAERTLRDTQQLTLPGIKADERKQIDEDRKYLEGRARALRGDRAEEPNALRAIYEVLQTRTEPVGLVYLWPATRG